MAAESRPYAQAAAVYRERGWAGVLPLPPRAKKDPPAGFTGHKGKDPSDAQIATWIKSEKPLNIAIIRAVGAAIAGLTAEVQAHWGEIQQLASNYMELLQPGGQRGEAPRPATAVREEPASPPVNRLCTSLLRMSGRSVVPATARAKKARFQAASPEGHARPRRTSAGGRPSPPPNARAARPGSGG